MALRRSSTSSSSPDPRLITGPPGRAVQPRRLLRLMAAGCVILPFATGPLARWSEGLPEEAAPIRDGLAWMDGQMRALGLAAPFDTIHRTARWLAAP